MKGVGLLPSAIDPADDDEGGFRPAGGAPRAIECVRRGGTVSVLGVYGGAADPMPMMQLFDKQIQLRMGQANVRRWTDDLVPLVTDDGDPLGEASRRTTCRWPRRRRPTRASRTRTTAW